MCVCVCVCLLGIAAVVAAWACWLMLLQLVEWRGLVTSGRVIVHRSGFYASVDRFLVKP